MKLLRSALPSLMTLAMASPIEAQESQQQQSESRPLRQFCHLGVRVLDHEDGSTSFDCFCDLLGNDRYHKGPNRMSIVSSTPETEYNFDPCRGILLERAITNHYHIYVDAIVNDTVDELEVMEWSTTEFLAMKDTMKKEKAASYQVPKEMKMDSSTRKLRKNTDPLDGTYSDAEVKENRRSLQYTHGQTIAWELLVVNVGGKDYDPPSNVTQLIDDWFEDDASLATQMAQCSANKTTFSPWKDAAGNDSDIFNGVMTILLNQSLAGIGVRTLESLVFEELADRGIVVERETGKIALCFPQESFDDDSIFNSVAGYAVPNGNVAVYKGKHCSFVSTQMHEIGHTLGLQHAGDLIDSTDPLPREDIFGDFSGIMGGWLSGDDAEICFNAAKTWQLGWRPTKDIIVGTDEPDLVLTSFVDWDGQETTYCIARVVTPDAFFFVHYNRKKGANIDTQEYGDKVIVTRRSSKSEIRDIVSYIVAALSVDEIFSVENVDGLGANMTIIVNSMDDSTVDISIAFSIANVAPTTGPARNPMPLAESQSLLSSSAPSGFPSLRTPNAKSNSRTPSSPLLNPSSWPSQDPTSRLKVLPSQHSVMPSYLPSLHHPVVPTGISSDIPSGRPSVSSSFIQSVPLPSTYPSLKPSLGLSSRPTSLFSIQKHTPSSLPSRFPSAIPTFESSDTPSQRPSSSSIFPSGSLTSKNPSVEPSLGPTSNPTDTPSQQNIMPSYQPTNDSTDNSSEIPSQEQSVSSSVVVPSLLLPTNYPSKEPSSTFHRTYPPLQDSVSPFALPSMPSGVQTDIYSGTPSQQHTSTLTKNSSVSPSNTPTKRPTMRPTLRPTKRPTKSPTNDPTRKPTTELAEVQQTSNSLVQSTFSDSTSLSGAASISFGSGSGTSSSSLSASAAASTSASASVSSPAFAVAEIDIHLNNPQPKVKIQATKLLGIGT